MKKTGTILLISAFLLTFMLTKTINVMQDTKEIWKEISVSKVHQVSNLGNVRSLDHYVNAHNVQTRKTYNRLIKGRLRVLDKGSRGYLMIRFTSKGKYHAIHRLVANAFIPNPNNLPQINHKNGIKHDNRVENLEWCTVSQNIKHAFDIGLKSKYWGSNAHLA